MSLAIVCTPTIGVGGCGGAPTELLIHAYPILFLTLLFRDFCLVLLLQLAFFHLLLLLSGAFLLHLIAPFLFVALLVLHSVPQFDFSSLPFLLERKLLLPEIDVCIDACVTGINERICDFTLCV